jgi:putative nucleotidyltransferase with HDIG domain
MADLNQTRRTERFEPSGGPAGRRRVSYIVWLVAAGFFIAIVCLVALGSPAISLRPGDQADKDYISRVRFQCPDLSETEYNRRVKRLETPERYSPSEEGRDAIQGLQRNLLRILEDARLKGAAAGAIESLSEQDRQALADYALALPEESYKDLLDFRDANILDPADYRRVVEGARKIVALGDGEREVPIGRLVDIDSVDSYVTGLLQSGTPAGVHREVAGKAAHILASLLNPRETLKSTLIHEKAITEKARDEAALSAPLVHKTVLPGEAIIMKNTVVDEQRLIEIREERKQYEATLPLAARMERLGGAALLALILLAVGAVYLHNFQRNVLISPMRFFIFAALLLTVLLAAKLIVLRGWQVYLIPISFSAMVLTIAYTPRMSLAVSWMLAAVIGLMAGMDMVIFIYLVAGSAVAAFGAAKIRRRSKIIKVGFATGLAYVIVICGESLIRGAGYDRLPVNSLAGMMNGVFVAFVVSGILPFIEKWFNITTDISLLELSDQNHPLMRRLIFSAPGTYHHSLIVGNLAEEAAAATGANALLARVGSYFHDIGKLSRPDYFIENEPVPGQKHSKLTTPMSTTIILAHTKDGAELAREYKLPSAVRAIIQQHHGTSILEYFYHEALGEFGGTAEVDEASFRYDGPRPRTKEAGIVLLADACEAASRALGDPAPKRLENMIDEIITHKMRDGQLDECALSLTDLAKIRDSFARILSARFHMRVKYPEAPPAAKKGTEAAPDRQETSFYTRRRQFDA